MLEVSVRLPIMICVAMGIWQNVSAADAARGGELYVACQACHSGTSGAVGPALDHIAGRKAGTLAVFRYSNALKSSDITWSEGTLTEFLLSPQSLIPGNRMAYEGIGNRADAADLAAFLISR